MLDKVLANIKQPELEKLIDQSTNNLTNSSYQM